MKKNLYLLGILAALLVGTYVFQELRVSRLFEASLTKDHLIAAQDIQKLEFSDVKAEKKNDQWWSNDQLLSHNVFKQIVTKISHLKKIKTVEGDPKNYFSHGLTFQVNGEKWMLGDLTLDRQGFYLMQKDKVMIAVMEGEGQELVADPAKAVENKLQDLKQALSMKLSALHETQLFRFYPQLPLGKVSIETDGRQAYELDLLNNTTTPAPIQGISTHDNILEKFTSLLTQMTIRKEVKYEESLKFVKLGQMVFSHEKKKVTWELWLKGDNSADSYVIDPDKKRAWLMVGGTLRNYFLQPQDYWDKKVIPSSVFEHFSKLPVTFSQGSRSATVEVINREPLDFKTKGFKVNSEKMNILFQYIFNLSEKDQAARVSQLSKSEKKEILSGNHLRAEVMEQELLFWRKADELIVVNLTQGFKAHFFVRDESFHATFEDVLK